MRSAACRTIAVCAASLCVIAGLLYAAAGCKRTVEEPAGPEAVTEAEEKPMGGKALEGKSVLMIIARQNFRDEELAEPRAVLEGAGAKVTIASSAIEDSVGMLGRVRVRADITLDAVDPKAYDAVIFVGGQGASEYFDDATAHRIAREADEAGKVVGAICIAPATLANAGLLAGKKATSFASVSGTLTEGGADFTGGSVEVDGRIITADGPDSARKFGEAIRDALARK